MKFPIMLRKEHDGLLVKYERCRDSLAILHAEIRNLESDLEEERKRSGINGSSREKP